MKILRVTSLGYVGGGVENGIILMKPVLERMGHTVKVLSSDHNPSADHFNDYAFPNLTDRSFLTRLFYRAYYPASRRALEKVLREFKPDVVQLHTWFEVSPSVLFALRDYPTVVTVHGADDFTQELLLWAFPPQFFKQKGDFAKDNLTFMGRLHFLYHRYISLPIFRRGFRSVDRFVVFSRYMQDMMTREGIESVVVPNATKLFTPTPIDPAAQRILYVGRLEEIKGVHHLIEALPEVLREHPRAQLTIAGTGEYEYDLKQLVEELGLSEHVTFAGHCSRKELHEYYKAATVVVVPSVWPEPFGKVGLEAMSVGRPVIGTDVGGIQEWLSDGQTGYLIPPSDPQALASRLHALFSDPVLIVQMADASTRRAQDFTIEKHTERMCALYQEVIEETKQRNY